MNELPSPLPTAPPQNVFVRIAGASGEQVSPIGVHGPVPMRVSSVKGKEVELEGPHFFPKNCELEITWGEETPAVGTVRKVLQLGTAPTYGVWVRVATESMDRFQALTVDGEKAHDRGLPYRSASLPDWASRLAGEGEVSPQQLEEIAARASGEARPLAEALVGEGLVLEERIASSMAMDQGVPFVDPTSFEIQRTNSDLIPLELALRYRVFALFDLEGVITLGMVDPTDLAVIDQVRLRTSCQVDPCLVAGSALDSLIERLYRRSPTQASLDAVAEDFEPVASISQSSNQTVRLVNSLIEESARDGVSDIHIEPEKDKLRIRIRVDGILHEHSVHPLKQHAPIVSRIKVLSKLDIAETRRPQDGHFSMRVSSGNADMRVSTIPTVHGENVVLRLSISDGRAIDLNELGMPPEALRRVEDLLEHPNGMILVTGPTGSGKTTTLYAALARLSTIERNVVTIEDPVEKRLPLLRQTEVNPKAGVTFATGLRSMLRQDPDVIMVGEIRDQETAEISVQAALTGHLVLSTLHTNTAAGAIVRLSEIGIAPFLITSSLRAVISQRLARRVCEACPEEVVPSRRLTTGLEYSPPGGKVVQGAGCGRCMHTGYRGRVGLYEMLHLSPGLSAALLSGAPRDALAREARRALFCDMRADGLRKVEAGQTTLEEVARIVGLKNLDAIGAELEG